MHERTPVSTSVYGRERQLHQIESLRSRAASGEGSVLALVGEAGIGKSRLAALTLAAAAADGWQVLRSPVYEQDRIYPNGVLTGLLRQLIAKEPERAAAALAPVSGSILQLVPEAQSLFPNASGPRSGENDPRLLFSLAVEAMVPSAPDIPRLLFIDDLHWADDASLDFLLTLARQTRSRQALLLFTFRDDDAGPALSHLLAALDRERLLTELRLARLTLSQVEAMVRDLLGLRTAVRADFLHALFSLTDGNPFFVEELLRSSLNGGDAAALDALRLEDAPIPRSVQEAVSRRTAGLSEGASRLLQLAAVTGMRFDFDLLAAISGHGDVEMLAQIKELIACQLLREESEDIFVFRHALTAQAVSSAMLVRERRTLHRRVVAALEAMRPGEEALEDLAYHSYAAADWPRAAAYLERAGERALRLNAPGVALDDFNRAVQAAERLQRFPALSRLYLAQARANDALSDFDHARSAYEKAIMAADEAGDARTAWQATLDMGLLWASRDYLQAFHYYEDAVRRARVLEDQDALARSLMRLGNGYANTGDFAAARRNIEEALDVFRAKGNSEAEAQALDVLGMACIMGGLPLESARHYTAAIPILEGSGDLRTLSSTLATLAVCAGTYQTDFLPPAMTLAEAEEAAQRALAIARDTGIRQDESYALWQLGFCMGPAGKYEESLANTRRALALAEELGHEQWTTAARIVLGANLLDIFDLEGARAALEQAHAEAKRMNSVVWEQQSLYFLAEVYLQMGRPDLARSLLEGAPIDTSKASIARCWHEVAAAAHAIAESRAAEAASLLDGLRKQAAASTPGAPGLRLDYIEAQVAMLEHRKDDALARLRAAIDSTAAHGHRSLLWRSRCLRAGLLLEAGEREAARAEADAALTLIDGLAASIPEGEMAERFRQKAQALLPGPLRRRPRTAAGELTEREAEIAARIARGMSNRAIADELVLSSRTVETHVANAMSKMGFSARAQLAAWAVEHGL